MLSSKCAPQWTGKVTSKACVGCAAQFVTDALEGSAAGRVARVRPQERLRA